MKNCPETGYPCLCAVDCQGAEIRKQLEEIKKVRAHDSESSTALPKRSVAALDVRPYRFGSAEIKGQNR